VQAAGGSSFDGVGSVLDQKIDSVHARSLICVGSSELVEESKPAMRECLDTL
jgi:fructose-1,6-bisphosphatase